MRDTKPPGMCWWLCILYTYRLCLVQVLIGEFVAGRGGLDEAMSTLTHWLQALRVEPYTLWINDIYPQSVIPTQWRLASGAIATQRNPRLARPCHS